MNPVLIPLSQVITHDEAVAALRGLHGAAIDKGTVLDVGKGRSAAFKKRGEVWPAQEYGLMLQSLVGSVDAIPGVPVAAVVSTAQASSLGPASSVPMAVAGPPVAFAGPPVAGAAPAHAFAVQVGVPHNSGNYGSSTAVIVPGVAVPAFAHP